MNQLLNEYNESQYFWQKNCITNFTGLNPCSDKKFSVDRPKRQNKIFTSNKLSKKPNFSFLLKKCSYKQKSI